MNPIVSVILICLGVFILIGALITYRKQLSSEAKVSFLLGIVLFVLSYILPLLLPTQFSPEHKEISGPILEPILRIIKITTNRCSSFEVQIRNLGNISAIQPEYYTWYQTKKAGFIPPQNKQEIAPGGILRFQSAANNSSALHIMLYLSYSFKLAGQTHKRTSFYKFPLPTGSCVGDTEPYETSFHAKKYIPFSEVTRETMANSLEWMSHQPIISYFFWFNELSYQKKSQNILFSLPDKRIIYDSTMRAIKCVFELGNKKSYSITRFNNTNIWHHIGLVWSNNTAKLYIDGCERHEHPQRHKK